MKRLSFLWIWLIPMEQVIVALTFLFTDNIVYFGFAIKSSFRLFCEILESQSEMTWHHKFVGKLKQKRNAFFIIG